MHPCLADPAFGVEIDEKYAPRPEPAERLWRALDVETPSGRRLLAVADPLPGAGGCPDLIAETLQVCADAFRRSDRLGLEQAVANAFEQANSFLWVKNRARSIGDPRLRTFAGLTAVCAEGRDVVFAALPPGQALLLRDGEIHGVPTLAMWEGRGLGDEPGCSPLGFRARTRPRLVRTCAEPADLVMLGSAVIGRAAAGMRERVTAGASGGERVDAFTRTIEDALAGLGVGAFAACVALADWLPAAEEAAQPAPRQAATHDAPVWNAPARRPDDGRARGERVHDRLVEMSERLTPRRRDASLPMEGRRRAAAPPGAGSLRRYHTQSRPARFLRIRTRLPRTPRVRVTGRVVASILAFALVAGGVGFGYDVRQAGAARQDRSLWMARAEITAAVAADGSQDVDGHLRSAERWLTLAAAQGASPADVDASRSDLSAAQDRAHGNGRLSNLTLVGALPVAIDRQDARLVTAGGRLYLVAAALYELDPVGRRLTPVLAPGDSVDGFAAAPLRFAAADGDALVVSDGATLFRRARNGDWSATAMAARAAGGPWTGRSGGAYRGGFYLLGAEGDQILKFAGSDVGAEPTRWAKPDAAADLAGAIDIVVDGGIVVLRGDGVVARLYQGSPVARVNLGGEGRHDAPVALSADASSALLSVLIHDDGAGRIVQLDPDLKPVRTLLSPDPGQTGREPRGSEALRLATDFAIDDAAGVVYLLTPSGVWSATFAALEAH